MMHTAGSILKGVIVGAYIGYVLGKYLCILTSRYVIQYIDYTHSLYYEKAQERFCEMIVLSFVIVFAFIGPFVAAASFGRWMRHAVYGLVGCIALVVGVTLARAAYLDEQPFHESYMDGSTSIDAARLYGIPASFVIGPLAGILIGRFRDKKMSIKPNQ